MQKFVEFAKAHLNIEVTAGGVWAFNKKLNKKEPVDILRKSAKWSEHPKDNMGVMFIEKHHNILVVDIDGEHFTENADGSIYIPSLNTTFPPTLITSTSKPGSRHLYYKTDTSLIGNRIVKVQEGVNVDIFTYGMVFDLHSYSPTHSCNYLVPIDAPKEVVDLAEQATDRLNAATQPTKLAVRSNIARERLINDFLEDNIKSVIAWNAFFRSVFPSKVIKKGARKITFESFKAEPFYDLINGIAVKLTTTSELGLEEHTLPALKKIVTALGEGRDGESAQTNRFLSKQILPSLPLHPPIKPYCPEYDSKTLIEHIDEQPETATPIFKVILNSKISFIQLDRYSLAPIKHNNDFYFDRTVAELLNPERLQPSAQGDKLEWNDEVPLLYLTDSPYEPQWFIDDEKNRNVVNLYERTKYLIEATPSSLPENIITKFFRSSVPPEYLHLVHLYYAHVIFGDTPPTAVLWMASLPTDIGGTGKSILTIDLFSKVLGSAAVAISKEDMTGNWGDVLVGARIISLEDLQRMSSREFNDLYAAIKQATSSALKRLNMKGVSFRTERVRVTVTGSSNDRLSLHTSDRRFLCLEPAHLRGMTEQLGADDALTLERFRKSDVYSQDLQDLVNYWKYLAEQPLTVEEESWLYIAPPQTEFRRKWVLNAKNHTANVIPLLKTPLELLDTVKYEALDSNEYEHLIELFTLPITTFKEATGKVAFPWNWFPELFKFIQSDKYKEEGQSKSAVQSMLGIEFTNNVGNLYSKDWSRHWKVAGYVIECDQQTKEEWVEAVKMIQESKGASNVL